ncbi:MAG: SpoIIE family protein phosphatase [Bacteroidales bacterium]|nr:SpoIIE family protein phosphatase [Bacteroidales bacterium]
MTNDKSKIFAVRVMYSLIFVESIAVLLIMYFVLHEGGGNLKLVSILAATLLFFISAIICLRYKKYNWAKFIIITIPPYAILAVSVIEKYYGIFGNVYSYLTPRFFEIIYLMVPIILFGIVNKRKMLIAIIVIFPPVFLFSYFHELAGIDVNKLVIYDKFYSMFLTMVFVFYLISAFSVLSFQKTSIMYKAETVQKSKIILKEKEELKEVKEEIERQNKLLSETNNKYNLLSDNLIDFIWMFSLDFRAVYVSPSCEDFLGFTSEELYKMPLSAIHTKKSYDLITETLNLYLQKRKNNEKLDKAKLEVEYIHKNGNIIIAEVIGSLIIESNEIIGFGGISRNITERKETEAALAKSNKKLKAIYKDLVDNISYAKKIQDGLLTEKSVIDNIFNEYFLLFKPRYTVGGDFYYMNKMKNYIIFAVGDCTGHGISGGFLTMTAITYLHEIVRNNRIQSPDYALELLRRRIKRTYKNFDKDSGTGFNIALCAIDTKTNILRYSGAYHPLILIRNGKLTEIKAVRNPVGYYIKESPFVYHDIQLEKNDKIYIFSDGYYDQINPEGKKIGKKQFKILLEEISELPFEKQEKRLLNYLENWKQDQYQIDDITVFGMKS